MRKRTMIRPSREKYHQTVKLMKDLTWLKAQSPIFKDVSVHDLYPETPTIEIVERSGSFEFTHQKEVVNDERHMISDQTVVPAGISNKVQKTWIKMKQVFHKNAPTAITTTKKSGLESRTLGDTYKHYGGTAVIGGIVLIYLLTKRK